MRLDEAELEELRRWGLALQEADREESGAAGRAILMLVEELEQLRLDLWRTREQLDRIGRVSNDEVEAAPVASVLHGRLRRMLARGESGQPLEAGAAARETGSHLENDAETVSALSWIERLRQEK